MWLKYMIGKPDNVNVNHPNTIQPITITVNSRVHWTDNRIAIAPIFGNRGLSMDNVNITRVLWLNCIRKVNDPFKIINLILYNNRLVVQTKRFWHFPCSHLSNTVKRYLIPFPDYTYNKDSYNYYYTIHISVQHISMNYNFQLKIYCTIRLNKSMSI